MSVQDLTFDDIEKRYPELKGMVDLIIEDEGHKHYVGEKTSKRLRFLENVPTISLSATPHNIIGNYINDLVVKYETICNSIVYESINIILYSKCIQVVDNVIYLPMINSNNYVKITNFM